MILNDQKASTLLDYILWRGDLSFSAAPFQKEDSLVLCLLSYLDMSPCMHYSDLRNLRDVYETLRTQDELKVCFMGDEEEMLKIIAAAASSERFGSLMLSRYTDLLNEEESIQFCALTIQLLPRLRFLAFRGTDSSIAGWKEDFMICFRRTASQTSALHYLQHALSDSTDDILIGGHSKGANLALYAAAELPPEYQSRVKEVYFLDGPGFCPDVLDEKHITAIREKIIRIVPELCVIGRLYRPTLPHNFVVKSHALGLYQHDLSSWCIEYGHVLETEVRPHISDLFVDNFMDWISDMTMEERPAFVEDLFDRISAGGEISSLDDFEKNLPAVLEHLILRRTEKMKMIPPIFESLIGGNEHE